MKEIDFLPEWYTSGRRRKVGYQTQYIALAGILVVMTVYNSIATYSISRAGAALDRTRSMRVQRNGMSTEFSELTQGIAALQKKLDLINNVDSRIDVAGVLAELSFLVDERIVLSKVDLTAEKFKSPKASSDPSGGTIPRAVSVRTTRDEMLPLGGVRFKVTIGGVGADAGDVAALMCKLEESPYFFQVVLRFSQNSEIRVKLPDQTSASEAKAQGPERDMSLGVTEFEISCYLANYIKQQSKG